MQIGQKGWERGEDVVGTSSQQSQTRGDGSRGFENPVRTLLQRGAERGSGDEGCSLSFSAFPPEWASLIARLC